MSMSEYMRRLRDRVGHDLLELPSVTVAIRDERGRLLLARHSVGDVWVLPGGALEPEETPADAAVREAWEETGLRVHLERLLGVYGGPECTVRYPNGDATSYLIVAFEGRAAQGKLRPDGAEILELAFFAPEKIAGLPLARWLPAVLADVFRPRTEAAFQSPTWRPPGDA
jgi:8-oxo-dGTP pyrophosphatase MutT (NUDIX family)